jgi:hypothetical protein
MNQVAIGLSLCSVLTVAASASLADERPTNPGIVANTAELLRYRDVGYRFRILGPADELPEGFQSPTFDESTFGVGIGAFGSGGICPLQGSVATAWPSDTSLILRRKIRVSEGTTNVRVMIAIDNDILRVYFNGQPIGDAIAHDDCPIEDEFRVDVPQDLVRSEENTLVVHAIDRGQESFLDLRVLGDVLIPAVQLSCDKRAVFLKTPYLSVDSERRLCRDPNAPTAPPTLRQSITSIFRPGSGGAAGSCVRCVSTAECLGGFDSGGFDCRITRCEISNRVRRLTGLDKNGNMVDSGTLTIKELRCNCREIGGTCRST